MDEYFRFPSFEPSAGGPLSADIFMFKGIKHNYLFDLGANKQALEFIRSIENPVAIISHFHADHCANARVLLEEGWPFEEFYAGKKTCDSLKVNDLGTVVNESLVIDDGIHLEIIPMPSCHAKGSLMVKFGRCLFVGDGLYGGNIPSEGFRYGYNAGVLLEEIRELEKVDCDFFVTSHTGDKREKKEVLDKLRMIYSLRDGNSPYIIWEEGI